MYPKSLCVFASCIVVVLVTSLPARAGFVINGSLEDTNGTWVNTNANYMALTAGSTAIAGWTVAPGTVNEIVWGKTPTGDNPPQSAADGLFFVDLTGFGSDSPNGAIQQSLNITPAWKLPTNSVPGWLLFAVSVRGGKSHDHLITRCSPVVR